jgi:hypothetical protein
MRKFLKVFFSLAVTIYFSTTMFYCFVAGAPQNGKGAVIYVVSAAGLSILFPSFTCGCIHYIIYLRKKLDKQGK